MKKFFKYVPVALGLMALASCSNDEFANESAALQSVKQGDLVAENEVLELDGAESTTRSYLSRDLKVRMYVTDDEIKAYDDELNKYDIYAFSWNDPSAQTDGVFRRHNTASNLDGEPKWALYPSVDGQEGHWYYNKETNNTLVTLTSTLEDSYAPNGTYQKSDTKFENPLFKDVLPRWGQVTATENGSALHTSLKYLTGVLRLQLNGAPDYADKVVIQVKDGDDYLKINGEFKTTLAINDVMQTAEFAAEKTTKAKEQKITVNIPSSTDLQGIDALKSVVFIPLPTTNHSVNIEVYYYKGTTPLKKETFENKTIKRAKVYGHTAAINFAETGADNAAGISDAIALEDVAEDEDLVVKVTQPITTTTKDNIIYIPNLKCKSITVDLTGVTSTLTAGLIVKYKDVEGEGKYKNPVILKTGVFGTGSKGITVQLDETPFVLGQNPGYDLTGNQIDANAFTLTGNSAGMKYKQGKFALSDNVKTLNVNGCEIDAITTFPKLTAINVNDGATVAGKIIAGTWGVTATVTGSGSIDGSTISGDISATGNIVIKEKCNAKAAAITSASGNVTLSNSIALTYANPIVATTGDVTLSGKSAVTGKVTAGQDFSVSENASAKDVDVKRDATINIGYEGMAVSSTLKYNGNGKLNLFNGYVWEVDANDKTVGLYHGEKAGFTAIGKLSNGGQFAAKNTSIWNGQQAGYANFYSGGLNLTDGANVWTATQLAWQINNAADFNLNTDVDLDNKDWAGIKATTAYSLTGNGKTIKNVNLTGLYELSALRAGFIAYSNANVTVSGLTLDGVKTTIKQLASSEILEGVGGLIGKVSSSAATATLSLVNVKLAAGYFGSLSKDGIMKNTNAKYIGGLIGQTNAATTTIKGCTADLTGAVLAGHQSLGGFVGKVGNGSKAASIKFETIDEVGDQPQTKCAVTGLTKMHVTLLDLGTDENDTHQGMTGYYLGSFSLIGTATLTIQDADNVNPSFTVSGEVDLDKAFQVQAKKMYAYAKGNQSLIGQSGLVSSYPTATINGETYKVKVSSDGMTPDHILYNVNVSTYK